MSRIETMLGEFSKLGYTVLNPFEYSKLDSKMHLKCPHGHFIIASLEDIRKPSFICEECNFEKYGGLRQPLVKNGGLKVVAIDGATENAGVSLFQGNHLVDYKAIKISNNHNLPERLAIFRKKIIELVIETWDADYVVIEDIQFQGGAGNKYSNRRAESYYSAFKALAMLQGVMLETCTEYGMKYKLVTVNTWRAAFGIAGYKRREAKQKAMEKVDALFSIKTRNDDVAEAILIGAWGAHYIDTELNSKLF